jgi:hypothetical protein
MLYLQTQAIRTESRQVELGGSMRAWLQKLGIEAGGKTRTLVREQVERIASCKISFQGELAGVKTMRQQTIVDDVLLLTDDGTSGCLFREGVTLSERFFATLKDHSVPLEERAIRHIQGSSMALDAYAWLAWRLHALKGPVPVPWKSLHQQFGTGFRSIRDFKPKFRKAMLDALAVYPEASERGVGETDMGYMLKPCGPPIPKKLTRSA